MYIPAHFQEHDLHATAALVREFSFGTLVSVVDGLPWATHIPFQLEIDKGGEWLLHCHVAKANEQWKALEKQPAVLTIFRGPHSYISPSWYDKPNVPTWNYQAVHLSGKATIMNETELQAMLRSMMKHYETAHAEHPLDFDAIPKATLDKDLKGVIGITIRIEKIEAVRKLSQNRNDASKETIIHELKKLNAYDAARIAEEMRKTSPK